MYAAVLEHSFTFLLLVLLLFVLLFVVALRRPPLRTEPGARGKKPQGLSNRNLTRIGFGTWFGNSETRDNSGSRRDPSIASAISWNRRSQGHPTGAIDCVSSRAVLIRRDSSAPVSLIFEDVRFLGLTAPCEAILLDGL